MIRSRTRSSTVLFSNPPWWEGSQGVVHPDGERETVWTGGMRAGARWPHTAEVDGPPDAVLFGRHMPYPFFLGGAASWVQDKLGGKGAAFRDSIAMGESEDSYFAWLEGHPAEYIVIESAAPCWPHDAGLIRRIKERHPGSKIILTGSVTAKAAEILEHHPVHACIRGEYEKGVMTVLNGADGIIESDLLTVEEMNASPYPWLDFKNAFRYWDPCPTGQEAPQLQLLSSRPASYGKTHHALHAAIGEDGAEATTARAGRQYSADHIEGLIRDAVGRFGYRTVYFDDDTFSGDDRHVLAISQVMARIGLPWSAMCRPDALDRDTWRAMRESGCFGVKLGFECGHGAMINAPERLAKARATVFALKDLGLSVHGIHTHGFPGETAEQIRKTKRWIQTLPLDSLQETGEAEAGSPAPAEGTGQACAPPFSGTVYYLDMELMNNVGHYANACRHITGELKRREIPVQVFGTHDALYDLVSELGVRRFFHRANLSGDLTGLAQDLLVADRVAETLTRDLERLPLLKADDLVYVNSVSPYAILPILQWFVRKFTPETMPQLAMEFGQDLGIEYNFQTPYKHLDLSAPLYQRAFRLLPPPYRERVRLYTFQQRCSDLYATLLDLPVGTFAYPQRPPGGMPRFRDPDISRRDVVIGFAGHQGFHKGFHFIPDLARRFRASGENLCVLVHSGAIYSKPDGMEDLTDLVAADPKVALLLAPADEQMWWDLLDRLDLLVLPYQPERYRDAYSAVLAEAISSGLPVVVPGETSLADLMERYGMPGTCFSEWTADSIWGACHTALQSYGDVTDRSKRAAIRWMSEQGPGALVDALLYGDQSTTPESETACAS